MDQLGYFQLSTQNFKMSKDIDKFLIDDLIRNLATCQNAHSVQKEVETIAEKYRTTSAYVRRTFFETKGESPESWCRTFCKKNGKSFQKEYSVSSSPWASKPVNLTSDESVVGPIRSVDRSSLTRRALITGNSKSNTSQVIPIKSIQSDAWSKLMDMVSKAKE